MYNLKQHPKNLIQSGDIVDSTDYGLMRVILFQDELVLINDSTWMPLNSHDSQLRYSSVVRIIRPTCNMDLAKLRGTTIWQRKSEAEIKREAIQLEIDKLTKELEELK